MKISSKIDIHITLLLILAFCIASIFSYALRSIHKDTNKRLELIKEYHSTVKGITIQEETQTLTWHFLYSKNKIDIKPIERKYQAVKKLFQNSRFINQATMLLLTDYKTLHEESVQLRLELGLDHNSGLEGKLRQAIHKLEAKIDNDSILASMLMLHRHEKDFILRKVHKYIDKHRAEAIKLRRCLGGQTAELDSYLHYFNLYTYKLLHLHHNSLKIIAFENKILNRLNTVKLAYETEMEAMNLYSKYKLLSIYSLCIILISSTIIFSLIASVFMKNQVLNDLKYLKLIMHNFASGKRLSNTHKKRCDEVGEIIGLATEAIDKHQDFQAEVSKREVKEQLISNINHEMRTPLNGISLANQLLERTDLTKDQQDYTYTIKASSERLQELIDDLVSFDALSAGHIGLNLEKHNLSKLILPVQLKFQEKALHGSLRFETEFRNLAESAKMDGPKYQQVLSALLSNALKYTEKGYVKLAITINESQLITEVSDSGIGMTEKLQQNIFKGFNQGDNSISKGYSGLGLGLAITYDLVQFMEGSLTVDSELGKGSTFTFTVPITEALGEWQMPSKDKNLTDSFDYSLLLVDDQKMNLVLLEKTLRKLGCKVDKSFNGEEALELLKNKDYDLILMDLQMPVMDGITATEKAIKKLNVTSPIVACTANIEAETQDKCFEVGMSAFLTKPITQAKLKTILNAVKEEKLSNQRLIL